MTAMDIFGSSFNRGINFAVYYDLFLGIYMYFLRKSILFSWSGVEIAIKFFILISKINWLCDSH